MTDLMKRFLEDNFDLEKFTVIEENDFQVKLIDKLNDELVLVDILGSIFAYQCKKIYKVYRLEKRFGLELWHVYDN